MPDARTLLEEGLALQRQGELDAAFARYVAAADDPAPGVVALALRRQASVHRQRAQWGEAIAAAQRSAEIASANDLRDDYAEAVNSEAIVHQQQGDLERAAALLSSVPGIAEDPRIQGLAYQNMGAIAAQRGDFARARHLFLKSHKCFQRAGYAPGEAVAANNFGRAALDHGNPRVALPMLEDAQGTARRVGDRDLTAVVTRNLAEAKLNLGALDEALALAREALAYFEEHGNQLRRVECLRLLGDIAGREQRPDAAIACYDQALALATQFQLPVEVSTLTTRLDTARRQLTGTPAPLTELS